MIAADTLSGPSGRRRPRRTEKHDGGTLATLQSGEGMPILPDPIRCAEPDMHHSAALRQGARRVDRAVRRDKISRSDGSTDHLRSTVFSIEPHQAPVPSEQTRTGEKSAIGDRWTRRVRLEVPPLAASRALRTSTLRVRYRARHSKSEEKRNSGRA